MQLSDAGLDLVKRSEGFRSHTYLDVNGFPTIGYGHRILPSESFPGPIAETQANDLLASDLRVAEQDVVRLVKVPLTQGQFDALVDFCFNLGGGRLACSTLLKVLNGGRYQIALAAKPVFHRRLQSLQRHAMARLQHAILRRKRVVEDRIVGNVAHREVVDPV